MEKQNQETDPIKIAFPFIQKREAFSPVAYKDNAGYWTVGSGIRFWDKKTPVKEGDKITKEQNDKILMNRMQEDLNYFKTLPTYNKLNPNQLASLLSFKYNTNGGGIPWNETNNKKLLEYIKDPQKINSLPLIMNQYNKSNGQINNGLVNRRKEEADLFYKPFINPIQQPVKNQEQKQEPTWYESLLNMLTKDNSGNPELDTRPKDV